MVKEIHTIDIALTGEEWDQVQSDLMYLLEDDPDLKHDTQAAADRVLKTLLKNMSMTTRWKG